MSTSLNTRLGAVPSCLKRLVNILAIAPSDKLDNSGPLFTVSVIVEAVNVVLYRQ